MINDLEKGKGQRGFIIFLHGEHPFPSRESIFHKD